MATLPFPILCWSLEQEKREAVVVKRGTISACTREGKERKRLKSILSSLGKRKEGGESPAWLGWLYRSMSVTLPFFAAAHRPRDLGKEKEEEGDSFCCLLLLLLWRPERGGGCWLLSSSLKWNPRLLTPVAKKTSHVCMLQKTLFQSIGKCRNNSRVKNTASPSFSHFVPTKKKCRFFLLLLDDCAFSSCA